MSVVVTSFKNDKNARPPTLLKTVTTTDILIDQAHTFHNSYFENTCERLLLFYKKHIRLGACDEMCSRRNLSKNASIEAHRNIECINFRFQFPKFRLARRFTLSFYYHDLFTMR